MAVEGRGFPVSGSTFMIEGDVLFFFLFFFSKMRLFPITQIVCLSDTISCLWSADVANSDGVQVAVPFAELYL